ncbi:2-aminoethylphosphonate--pyruvate transaminase [Chondrinema litorale]|uniref:2-aminoethylphosphonate--pyruvate transaminase n=1 Tax=Chondrinema litorale TaxID=2994555 RepID=UPI00254350F2|nr:2-aminoethylphosphonate--pyruvate transaminase [Chondrinema litorale]UZR93555.1 2-aminoethylphosphonate--pyruvate transaminase [Chondrinema litorale]
MYPENPYYLLTPGPLSTSKSVKAAMLRDWCTWDDDYKEIVQQVRKDLLEIAGVGDEYTSVLMQGSGTFSVESVIGSVTSTNSKLLVLENGSYGRRIAQIAERLNVNCITYSASENEQHNPVKLAKILEEDQAITHVALVHCETTTGMLNAAERISEIAKEHGKIFILDAMSSFGGIPIDMIEAGIDFLISSANKCIQGVPGFGFVIAKKAELEKCKGRARSLALDLYDQWEAMENDPGKWRYTSPTHTVRAFVQALAELHEEGGVLKRYERYQENHAILVEGMREAGFETFLPDYLQSPIITAFKNPEEIAYNFNQFYDLLKTRGFVIYPGKVSDADTFRIGNIGHVFPEDFRELIKAVKSCIYWKETTF